MHQVDCFNIQMRFLKFLGIWPGKDPFRYYNLYCKVFIFTFVIAYCLLYSINFYFLPRQLDIFIEEMVEYLTVLAVSSKVLTFVFVPNKITELLDILESKIFQAVDAEGLEIIEKTKKFNKIYWKIVTIVSVSANVAHSISSLLAYLKSEEELLLPISRYAFLSDAFKNKFICPIYFYQSIGMHFVMWYTVNIDTFFLGLMALTIAQLEILDKRLRKVTDENKAEDEDNEISREPSDKNKEAVVKMNQCIIHFDEVSRFCSLFEEVFSVTLFVQFSMASCIICVCLFRFTMPAPSEYYIFLATYTTVMIIQIMIPCWFGTRIMDKSNLLAFSIYDCDWTPRSRQFKSNMRLFVERAHKPLSITGGKMFCLSLTSFTSIMNAAYSFFTLLQNVLSRE